jgi:AcrR family transcriptional regulator
MSPSPRAHHPGSAMDWQALATWSARPRTSRRGAETRERIIAVAADLFAARGIEAVALSEILERAGQANESAIHYHFGSREGLLVAIFHKRSSVQPAREERLRALEVRGDPVTLEDATAALVIPIREAMATKWGRDYVRLAAQALRHLPNTDRVRPDEPTSRRALELMEQRLVELPEDVRHERLGAAMTLVTEAWSSRAEEIESGVPSNLGDDAFERNLVDMILGMLTARVR